MIVVLWHSTSLQPQSDDKQRMSAYHTLHIGRSDAWIEKNEYLQGYILYILDSYERHIT